MTSRENGIYAKTVLRLDVPPATFSLGSDFWDCQPSTVPSLELFVDDALDLRKDGKLSLAGN